MNMRALAVRLANAAHARTSGMRAALQWRAERLEAR